MRLWAFRAPLWLVFVVQTAIFGGLMGVFKVTHRAQPAAALLEGLIMGSGFAAVMTWIAAGQRTRLWAVLGRHRSDEEVGEILRHVRRGQVPEDPERRDAVRRVAAMQRVGPKQRLLFGAVIVTVGVFAGWHALRSSPWWWLAVAAWVTVAVVSLVEMRRQATLWRRLG